MTGDGSAPPGLDDVRVGAAYDAVRIGERQRAGDRKQPRRVRLGESLALVFENSDTIRAILEEALRTERIDDPARVAEEVAAFNAIVPAPGTLAAVLFLEVADPADLNAAMLKLDGIERTVFIEINATRIFGVPDEVFPPGESGLAHYLRFALEPHHREAIRHGGSVSAGSDHPNCTLTVELDEAQRRAIIEDL